MPPVRPIDNLTYTYDLAGHINKRGGLLFQSILPTAVSNAIYDAAKRLTSRTAAGGPHRLRL
jgi:hypothetical protein